jgi:transcription elongation factor S-II
MAVNKLRMNHDPAVSDLAKDIVGKWKQDVQKVKSLGQDKARSTASPVASQTPITPPKPSGKKLPPKSKVDPSKRDKKTDGVNYSVTGDKTRDNCVGILYDGLCLDSDACMKPFKESLLRLN